MINENNKLAQILPFFPSPLSFELTEEANTIEEIRLRVNGRSQIVLEGGRSKMLTYRLTQNELSSICSHFCRGSYHTQAQNIKNSFISYKGGWRIGVCGRIGESADNSLGDITSVCIRVPRRKRGSADAFVAYLEKKSFASGVLVFAPPGVGKTTLLRETAASLASAPYYRRVVLIDSRGEFDIDDADTLDVFSGGRDKASAISCAVRTMAPQMIICDEIGPDEAASIVSSSSSGVPLIASAHASSLRELLSSPAFALMYKEGIFGCYARLSRFKGRFALDYNEVNQK